mmetsp:Transcript_26363/g.31109  ORF Transcript_26363/g.31109 Transcript_26363/m.31109 type:complete len:537 (-) Transcript_26363:238-1848(-)
MKTSGLVFLLWASNNISNSAVYASTKVPSKGAGWRSKDDANNPMIPTGKRLNLTTMSQTIRNMEYAVRGKVVNAADRINADLASSTTKNDNADFSHIVYTNIGNPHAVGQSPLTWPRQVLALTDLPNDVGINHKLAKKLFPGDAIARAKAIKESLGGHGTGAYTNSQGPVQFRNDICTFIEGRDGLEEGTCDPGMVFMTDGASTAIDLVLSTLIGNSNCGVMIPIPQYPIYSATIDRLDGQKVGYYLDEENGWDMNVAELDRALEEARSNGIVVNSFVLINPGNPTGQVLSKATVQEVVRFCAKNKLVLLADEVYQENIYEEKGEFYSCKKAAYETGLVGDDAIELVSFHSTSKGIFGECGRRGGYMELQGIDPDVKDQIVKLASSHLCSNIPGQIMMSLMVNGPKPGDESYASHEGEKTAIFESLKKRANIAYEGFNAIPGITCQRSQGAMYCFPNVEIPQRALDEAERDGVDPDTMYALSLLESTGICVVPAAGFAQKSGRHGFRTTFLPSEDEMVRVVDKVRKHHEEFCAKYA